MRYKFVQLELTKFFVSFVINYSVLLINTFPVTISLYFDILTLYNFLTCLKGKQHICPVFSRHRTYNKLEFVLLFVKIFQRVVFKDRAEHTKTDSPLWEGQPSLPGSKFPSYST